MDDPTPGIAAAAGIGIVFVLIYVALSAGAVALGLWITYTVIWRAVRRGLREYHHPGVRFSRPARSVSAPQTFGGNPRDW